MRDQSRRALAGAPLLVGLCLPVCAHAAGVCPAVNDDTTCGSVITITDSGTTVVQTGQGPYDGNDDTLVGVINKSSRPVSSIALASTLGIFGFDGDGLVAFGIAGNALDPTGYGGPDAYYTGISPDLTKGTVKFVTPIPVGGSAFFALENALASATSCADIINGSVAPVASGANIDATFTPKLSLNQQQAAAFCGFTGFNWVQTFTHLNDPSPYFARNIGGAFLAGAGAIRITSAMTPFNDPPPGGGYTYESAPDFSAPFYYDSATELPGFISPDGVTLSFHDAPANPCLPGGGAVKTALCAMSSEPSGSFMGFTTHLAGINAGNTATDLGIGFTWKSDWNGTSGGVAITKTNSKADPGTGTGGVVITSVNETTNYSYAGISVTGVNGGGSTATLVPGTALATTTYNLPFSYQGKEVTLSVVVLKNNTGRTLTGPLQVVFSSLPPGASLQNVSLTAGVNLAAPSGSFGGFPYVTTTGSIAAHGYAAVSVLITSAAGQAPSFTPLTYAGAFN